MMSYDIHVTRASHWSDSEEQPISLEELKEYFAGKDEFAYADEHAVSGPFGTMTIGGDFFIWKSEGQCIPFHYIDGRLTLSGGDEDVIEIMKEIAAGLQAIVQGDEGEVY